MSLNDPGPSTSTGKVGRPRTKNIDGKPIKKKRTKQLVSPADKPVDNTPLTPRRTRRPRNVNQPTPTSTMEQGPRDVEDGSPDIPHGKDQILAFCWICHKEWPGLDQVEKCCKNCTRVYHSGCLRRVHDWFSEELNRCPECLIQTVDGTNYKRPIQKLALARLLQHLLEKIERMMGMNMSELVHFTCPKTKDNLRINQMDLSILQDLTYRTMPLTYSSTAQFYSDVNWVYHNCATIGSNTKLERQAKIWRKHCEEELIDIEACPDCYIKTAENFTKICSIPHPIVWAKMKGHPFWPAKVLKVIDGKANVRFFGKHEKYRISVSECMMMSKDSPNQNVRDKAGYNEALKELKVYIANATELNGKFDLKPLNTPFRPGPANYSTRPSETNPGYSCSLSPGKRRRPRRGRPPKPKKRFIASEDEPSASSQPHIYSVSSDSDSDPNFVEVISCNMRGNTCNPGRQFVNSSTSPERAGIRRLPSMLSGDNLPSTSSTSTQASALNHYELDFYVDERDFVDNGSDDLDDLDPETSQMDLNQPTTQQAVTNVINRLVSNTSLTNGSLMDDSDAMLSMPSTSEMPIPSILPEYSMSHDGPPNIVTPLAEMDLSCDDSSTGMRHMFAVAEQASSRLSTLSQPSGPEKYCQKIVSSVLSVVRQVLSDMSMSTNDQRQLVQRYLFQARIEELEKGKADALAKISELMQNSTSILNILKRNYVKTEKRLLTQCSNAEKQAELLQQRLEGTEKELEALKEQQKVIEEKFEETLKEHKAEWERSTQERVAAAEEKCLEEMRSSLSETQAELDSVKQEYEVLKKSLAEKSAEQESTVTERLTVEETRHMKLRNQLTNLEVSLNEANHPTPNELSENHPQRAQQSEVLPKKYDTEQTKEYHEADSSDSIAEQSDAKNDLNSGDVTSTLVPESDQST